MGELYSDVKCTAIVLSSIHESLVFPFALELILCVILIIWFIYGLYYKLYATVLPYPLYYPKFLPKEQLSTLYFVRIFYSQRSAQFVINKTYLQIQFHYTDKTLINVECTPKILINALKYNSNYCCNFFVRSGSHVGQLNSVSLSHNSNGTVYVDFIEVVRLDNDPKTKFQAIIENHILPEKANKRRKYMFENPHDVEPDPDARPTNTITFYELILFFILIIQIASISILQFIIHLCTDADTGGCSRFKLVIIGALIGIISFVIWTIFLYFYISIIRKGLFNNFGFDSCNFIRLTIMVFIIGVICEIAFEIMYDSFGYRFGKVNAGSNVLNCDQSFTLTIITTFFVFYLLLGIMAPIYIIYRANYENDLIKEDEQNMRKYRNSNDQLKEVKKCEKIKSFVRRNVSQRGNSIGATLQQDSVNSASTSTTNTRAASTVTASIKNNNKSYSNTTHARTLMKENNRRKFKEKNNEQNLNLLVKQKYLQKNLSNISENTTMGYAEQMMKLNKVKSISQYILKKK